MGLIKSTHTELAYNVAYVSGAILWSGVIFPYHLSGLDCTVYGFSRSQNKENKLFSEKLNIKFQ